MAARRARAVCRAAVLVCWAAGWAAAGERTERFDKDPGWEGRNNRAATRPWRTGGDSPGGFATVRDPATGRVTPRGFKTGVAHTWSLKYDPAGNNGGGAVTVTLGGETAVCHLAAGHKADGATFDRFGLLPVLKSAAGGGEVWLDDVTIDGTKDAFDRDPGWEGVGNRRRYET